MTPTLYAIRSCDLIVAVVEADPRNQVMVGGKPEPTMYWWDHLDAEWQIQARSLPSWDINRKVWIDRQS
jgi:hypothetical protein